MPWKPVGLISIVVFCLALAVFLSDLPAEDNPSSLRNIGRSQYEEEKYDEAAKTFERLLSLTPDSAVDRVNLGIVLVQMEKYPEAREHLKRAESLDPALIAPAAYNLGISYKRERNFQEAARELERVLKIDPQNPDVVYNLAVVYESLGQMEKAFELATKAVEMLPDEVAPHYRRMMLAVRLQRMDVANQEKSKMAELRAQDARNRTPAELEMSIYTEIIEPERTAPQVASKPEPSDVKFEDISQKVGLGEVTVEAGVRLGWADIDGDGRQDLWAVGNKKPGLQIWRNAEAGFVRLELSGDLQADSPACAAGAGDFDHDADIDLAVAFDRSLVAFINQGAGKLERKDMVALAGCAQDLLVVDYDHDGDLDVYVAVTGSAPVMVRNGGQANFSPAPADTGLAGGGAPVRRLARIDFDDDNDTDFLLVRAGGPNGLLSNLRVGKFQDIAEKLGLAHPVAIREAAVADVNNDVWPDVVAAAENGTVAAFLGRKTGAFDKKQIAAGLPEGPVELFDFDNDGDEDALVAGRFLQNDGVWTDFSASVAPGLTLDIVASQGEDFDLDGDIDLAVLEKTGRLRLLRNEGGNRNSWLRVTLEGLQSNRFGVGTKVEVRENAFFQRKISQGRPVLFGLGANKTVDVLRMWWPTGVAQNILSPRVALDNAVREKLGPPSSCPYLYVWNGREFQFFTDVLDATALGVPLGDGTFWPHADKEDLLIPGSLLKEKDGRLLVQMTGELREIVYLDRIRLIAVDRPADRVVLPLDFAGGPNHGRSEFLEVFSPVPPRRAVDGKGQDHTAAIRGRDARYVTGFGLTRLNGLADTHRLDLDFGLPMQFAQPVLVLNGWVNWIDGDTLYAIGGGAAPAPFGPRIEVRTGGGPWQLVTSSAGLMPGIGKHLVVPLPKSVTGKPLQVRISTNMEIYWDAAFLADSMRSSQAGFRELATEGADLHFRGFSELRRTTVEQPPVYDYARVSPKAPWRPQRGFLTRYGDIVELLSTSDDRLAVFGPGDEITLRFVAPEEPPLPGRVRDYILRVDGWIKDGNPSTYRGDTVEPLPYKGMTSYPPAADKDLRDLKYWETVARFNTRTLN